GVGSAVVQAGLVGRIVAAVGERRTLIAGLIFGAIGFSVYGVAPTGAVFVVGIPIMSLWGMYSPTMQSLATRRVGRDRQGALQGALSSIQMTTGIVGPILFSEVFARSIQPDSAFPHPGAPYLLSAVLLVLAVFVAVRAAR